MPPTTMLDSHALVVSRDLDRYPPAPDAAPPAPGELEGAMDAGGLIAALDRGTLGGALLVLRNRFYGHDNALILDLAATDPRLRALCAVDGRAGDAEALGRDLLGRPGVAGLRFMEPEKGCDPMLWIGGDRVERLWRLAADRGALIDVHVFPWNRAAALPIVTALAARYPAVPVLVDNLGNGAIEAGAPDYGIDDGLRTLVAHDGVRLKFSDMSIARIERAGLAPADVIARHAALVGPERLFWGSDVLPPGRTLGEAAARAHAATASLDHAERALVLGGNAAALLGMDSVGAG